MDFMNAFVLVLVLNTGSVTTVQFQNEELCHQAIMNLKASDNGILPIQKFTVGVCVQVTDYEAIMGDE